MSRTYVVQCDRCSTQATVEQHGFPVPPGWCQLNLPNTNGVSMSGAFDLCTECAKQLREFLVKR